MTDSVTPTGRRNGAWLLVVLLFVTGFAVWQLKPDEVLTGRAQPVADEPTDEAEGVELGWVSENIETRADQSSSLLPDKVEDEAEVAELFDAEFSALLGQVREGDSRAATNAVERRLACVRVPLDHEQFASRLATQSASLRRAWQTQYQSAAELEAAVEDHAEEQMERFVSCLALRAMMDEELLEEMGSLGSEGNPAARFFYAASKPDSEQSVSGALSDLDWTIRALDFAAVNLSEKNSAGFELFELAYSGQFFSPAIPFLSTSFALAAIQCGFDSNSQYLAALQRRLVNSPEQLSVGLAAAWVEESQRLQAYCPGESVMTRAELERLLLTPPP